MDTPTLPSPGKLPKYLANPLTAWLPPEDESTQAVIARLEGEHVAPPSAAVRAMSPRARYFALEDLKRLHIVLPRELELEMEIAAIIREGYLDRAPTGQYWKNHDKEISSVMASLTKGAHGVSMCRIIAVMGTSACGKTISMEGILRGYVQVKFHGISDDPNKPVVQVVYIKFDFPATGSPKALGQKGLAALGDLVGEDYVGLYGHGTAEEVLADFARLCREHFVGLIVIDECQNGAGDDNGWPARMMKFLISMSNELRIPLALVGTPLAMARLQGRLASARRLIGVTYDRFRYTEDLESVKDAKLRTHKEDDNERFLSFLRELCPHRYIKDSTPLESFAATIYHHTQGILYFVCLIYILAQRRVLLMAMLGGDEKETLQKEHFDDVYEDFFKPVDPIIQALRSGDEAAIEHFQDLFQSFNIEAVLARESALTRKERLRIQKRIKEFERLLKESQIQKLAKNAKEDPKNSS